MTKVLDHLLTAIRDVTAYNPEVQVAPSCILWPDGDRQWEDIIPALLASNNYTSLGKCNCR